MPRIHVAFPCLNPNPEQWIRLEAYVRELTERVPGASFRFVVVDDGSPRWIEPPASLANRVSIIRLARNQGKGGALREAVRNMPEATDIFAFTDFDLPFPVSDLIGVCSGVASGADACVGDRSGFHRKGNPSDRFSRQLAHRLFRWFLRTVITGGMPDTQCGIKAYDAGAARWIAACGAIRGFLFDVEWLYIALRHKLAVRSWPVTIAAEHSSSRLRSFGIWKLARELGTLVTGILAKRYDSEPLREWIEKRLAASRSKLLSG